jgi:ribulose-5-phosphate 4-epimerase/fuculose-1-phosphate aldolase
MNELAREARPRLSNPRHAGPQRYDYGHVSALTTPRTILDQRLRIGLEEVTEDDLVLIDFEGNTLAGKRKRHNEFPIHSEVYPYQP